MTAPTVQVETPAPVPARAAVAVEMPVTFAREPRVSSPAVVVAIVAVSLMAAVAAGYVALVAAAVAL